MQDDSTRLLRRYRAAITEHAQAQQRYDREVPVSGSLVVGGQVRSLSGNQQSAIEDLAVARQRLAEAGMALRGTNESND